MQNVGPSARQAARWDTFVRTEIKKHLHVTRWRLNAFARPNQKQSADSFEERGWKVQNSNKDWDESIVSQVRNDTKENPETKAVVLITKDGDYVKLIKELKTRGVLVYLFVPRDDVSTKLVSAVGQKYLVTLP